MADDEFRSLTIVITIALYEGEYEITATKERWLSRQELRLSNQKQDLYKFKMDADPENGEVWLASTEFGNCTCEKLRYLIAKVCDLINL